MARGARTQAGGGTTNPLDRYAGLTKTSFTAPGWHDLDQGLLGEAALHAATMGDALLIGATSDGGALKILVFHGSQKIARYAATAAEADEILGLIAKAHVEP